MTVRYERPVSYAALHARRLALFAFILAVVGWGVHRFGPLQTPYFLAVLLASALLAVVALYLAFIGLVMLWNRGARGGKASAQAMFLVVVPLAPLVFGGAMYANRPQLYDVSSDSADPPHWLSEVVADQSWLGVRKPNGPRERELISTAYPGLTGRRYEGALDRVYAAAMEVALDDGIDATAERGAPGGATGEFPQVDPKTVNDEVVPDTLDFVPVPLPRPDVGSQAEAIRLDGDAYIQGVRRTLVFGFRQDVVIRLREEAETTLVDARVATRYGQHDLGSGAALIEGYFRALDAKLLGIAGD